MDFTLNEEQHSIAELANRILRDKLTPERLKEIEADPAWFGREEWAELAKADLLGLCLPEADGGGGYGMLEASVLLAAVGSSVAPLPLLATLVMGAMPIAEFGTDAQRAALLPGVIDGSVVLTAALAESLGGLPPVAPSTTAEVVPDAYVLRGTKAFVPAAHLAQRILVPAATGDGGSTVFMVDPAAEGVAVERQFGTNHEPVSTVTLDGVVVSEGDVLGAVGQGAEIVAWITDRAVAGLCATQAGVCESALRIAATYTSERQQFNAPIATFQAVAQRMADAYIDNEAVRLTALQAAWRLAEGVPADDALDIAKFWAAEGAQRLVHGAQHVHGGIGVDADYPIHRYFRWAKQIELTLGGGTAHLLRVGARLAEAPTS